MDDRRKTVGRRIKLGRISAGHRSQRSFAAAVGLHETSVARAETGDPRVGDSVFASIEHGLGWPEDCIARYLESGDLTDLPSRTADRPSHLPTFAELWDRGLPSAGREAELLAVFQQVREARGEAAAREWRADLMAYFQRRIFEQQQNEDAEPRP